MDPDTALAEALDLAVTIFDGEAEPGDDVHLAALVLAMNRWLTRGGFMPTSWGTADQRGPAAGVTDARLSKTLAWAPISGWGTSVMPASARAATNSPMWAATVVAHCSLRQAATAAWAASASSSRGIWVGDGALRGIGSGGAHSCAVSGRVRTRR